jgi:hypothetical protein
MSYLITNLIPNVFLHSYYSLTRSSNVAAQLERETQALLASLEEKVERRLEQLRMSLNTNALKKIRLSSTDLKVILLVIIKKIIIIK